ncbi:hypothetical protein BH10PLA2_BH10PLA2_12270 [soil metagenome]
MTFWNFLTHRLPYQHPLASPNVSDLRSGGVGQALFRKDAERGHSLPPQDHSIPFGWRQLSAAGRISRQAKHTRSDSQGLPAEKVVWPIYRWKRNSSESKGIARRMLAKLAGDSQLVSIGLVDKYEKHRARPLKDHLGDYRRHLTEKGDTAGHVAKTCNRLKAIFDGCEFKSLADVEASPVLEYLSKLQAQGNERLELPASKQVYTRTELAAVLNINRASVARALRRLGLAGIGAGKARRYSRETVSTLQAELRPGAGVVTIYHYLTAAKGFTRWLARSTRIPADPLSHLERQNPDVEVRRKRRALQADQFAAFVDGTAVGKSYRGISGPDRLVLYTLAANTGFRANELATLTPESFALLQSDLPTVTVEAGYSKRRRKDVQPLREDVAAMMREYLAAKPKRQPVWPGTWKDTAAEMLRADLATAGIPYRDDAGRYFDFHAMPGQSIRLLAANGVHPKVAQVLARHSTITLTMDFYTHLDVLDVSGALDKLPAIKPTSELPTATKKQKNGPMTG